MRQPPGGAESIPISIAIRMKAPRAATKYCRGPLAASLDFSVAHGPSQAAQQLRLLLSVLVVGQDSLIVERREAFDGGEHIGLILRGRG